MTLRVAARCFDPLLFEPPGSRRCWLVGVAIALYLIVPMWQTARAPRVGDVDMIRVGLVVYNRYARDLFAGDLAMQAGEWWPGYTPVYIGLLGAGYRIVGNFELMMFIVAGAARVSLLAGFYALGRRLGFPFLIALALALMSGLYVTSALGTAWTGVQLEMAAARNLYLALLPWIFCLALTVYRRPGQQTKHWLLLGFGLGLLANLHSINGIYLLCLLGSLMLVGVLVRRFRLLDALAFGAAALPGLALIYAHTFLYYANYYTDIGAALLPDNVLGYRYADLTKANLFFYRLPNWSVPIAIYGVLTALTTPALLRSSGRRGWWIAFGLTQFFGAALLMPLDWLVLFAGAAWIRRKLQGKVFAADTLVLLTLAVMGMLSLVAGSLLSAFAESSGFSPANFLSRGFQRGGTFSYGVLIVFAALAFWETLQRGDARSKLLFIASAAAVFVLGFHQQAYVPVLEAIPFSEDLTTWGQWLPVDPWIYLGVALLLLWHEWPASARIGLAGMLIFLAVTRLLAAPASDVAALLMGMVLFVTHIAWTRSHQPRLRLAVVAGVALAVIVAAPIGAESIIGRMVKDTRRVFLRDWSRTDNQSPHSALYVVGDWIRQHTPSGSLVIANRTFLRYWMLRPLVIGDQDALFLSYNPQQYNELQAEFERLQAAYASPEALLAFSREHDADYVVVPRNEPDMSAQNGVTLVYADDHFVVYAVGGSESRTSMMVSKTPMVSSSRLSPSTGRSRTWLSPPIA
jgi:hypothetical protein